MRFRRKTPTCLQVEPTECGAACLSIILQWYGRYVPLAELRYFCGVSRDGTDAANIVRAAQHYDLIGKGYKKAISSLSDIDLPVVIFWNFNHFLVLESIRGNSYSLSDPALGHRIVSSDEFDRNYTGVVLSFSPTSEFKPTGSRPSLLTLLSQHLTEDRLNLANLFVWELFSLLPLMLLPLLAQLLTDQLFLNSASMLFHAFQPWIYGTLFVLLALSIVRRSRAKQFALLISQRGMSKFLARLLSLPESFHLQRFPEDLASRQSLYLDIASFLSDSFLPWLALQVQFLFYFFLLLSYNSFLGLSFSLAYLANTLVTFFYWRQVSTKRHQRDTAEVPARQFEMSCCADLQTIQSSALSIDLFDLWYSITLPQAKSQYSSFIQDSFPQLRLLLFQSLSILTPPLACMYLVAHNSVSAGCLIAVIFIQILLALSQPLQLQSIADLGRLRFNLSRIEDVTEHSTFPSFSQYQSSESESSRNFPFPTPLSEPALPLSLSLQGLHYAYAPLGKPLLSDVSLTVSPGERIALVGASGSGKTTLGLLITGLLPPTRGEIFLGGIPLPSWPHHLISDYLHYIPQDERLFSTSIRNNLTLWSPHYTDDHLYDCLDRVGFTNLLKDLPDGLDTIVQQSNSFLSSGQRQRLLAARIFLKKPGLLVLDESTSACDPISEQAITNAIQSIGCTQIIIAHRLSSIRYADRIIVLKAGRIVQAGTHSELLANSGGEYAALYRSA